MLHLGLVLLQVSQTLLEHKVLLSLFGYCRIVGVTQQLEPRHEVRHVVLVERLQLVAHLLDLCPVLLLLLLVLL